jgi:hypothetical protein
MVLSEENFIRGSFPSPSHLLLHAHAGLYPFTRQRRGTHDDPALHIARYHELPITCHARNGVRVADKPAPHVLFGDKGRHVESGWTEAGELNIRLVLLDV